MPEGYCQSITYDHPVKIAVNTSYKEDDKQEIVNILYGFATDPGSIINKHCLDVFLPIMCRGVFSTCDPAFNVSINQRLCRWICEVISNFVCAEVWNGIVRQRGSLEIFSVDFPECNQLEYANGGEAPDCIDTLDGGE